MMLPTNERLGRSGVGTCLASCCSLRECCSGLFCLFAILYGGDSGGNGDTYVTIAGHELDADLAGAIALLIAFFAILFSTMFLRRERS